jgi:hypothetical protein
MILATKNFTKFTPKFTKIPFHNIETLKDYWNSPLKDFSLLPDSSICKVPPKLELLGTGFARNGDEMGIQDENSPQEQKKGDQISPNLS